MSADLFFQLVVEERGRLSPAIRDWLATAYDRWLCGQPLDRALGLTPPPGQRKPSTKIKEQQRNDALRAAWQLAPGPTPWKRSVFLAEAISRLGPIYRGHRSGRPPVSALNQHLCAARDHDDLPASPTMIHNICNEAS